MLFLPCRTARGRGEEVGGSSMRGWARAGGQGHLPHWTRLRVITFWAPDETNGITSYLCSDFCHVSRICHSVFAVHRSYRRRSFLFCYLLHAALARTRFALLAAAGNIGHLFASYRWAYKCFSISSVHLGVHILFVFILLYRSSCHRMASVGMVQVGTWC